MKKSNYLENSRFDKARERGEIFHKCIEQYWATGIPGYGGDYQKWVESFLSYKNLSNWKAVQTEFRMVDRKHGIAGTLDLILRNTKTGRTALCDYKTREDPKEGKKLSKPNHKIQMGGYLSLLQISNPLFAIDTVRIYWVTPTTTETTEYQPTDCLEKYIEARNHYFQKQLPF